MRHSTLDQQLRTLVAHFGKDRVVEALSTIASTPQSAKTEERRAGSNANRRLRSKIESGERWVLRACAQCPDSQAELRQLSVLYLQKIFLPNIREVSYFLREHGKRQIPRSRSGALRAVMETLASLPHAEIEQILNRTVERHTVGDFMLLANAIMGKFSTSTK